jgi:hypothetical protein
VTSTPRTSTQRSPPHLPGHRTNDLGAEQFSGANRSQCEPLGAHFWGMHVA